MLPVVEPDGRVTAQQIVVYTLMLITSQPVTNGSRNVGPDLSSRRRAARAALSLQQLRAAFSMSRQHARRLLLASVLYLPLLFILMVLNGKSPIRVVCRDQIPTRRGNRWDEFLRLLSGSSHYCQLFR